MEESGRGLPRRGFLAMVGVGMIAATRPRLALAAETAPLTVVLAGDIVEMLAFPGVTSADILEAHDDLCRALAAVTERGGQVNALAIDIEAAFLEYLDMFYNLGIAGRAMRRIGAIEFATTIAPGLRDVLVTGKIKESVARLNKGAKNPVYDAVVVDAPPTGRIARFLDVTKAVSDLAKGGPVHSQSEGVVKLLHSDQTAIHLVTLLEALPVQETLEAIEELAKMELPIGSVIVNRNIPSYLEQRDLAKAAEGDVDADSVRAGLEMAGIKLDDTDFAGLLTETIEHATRITARAETAQQLDALKVPRLELPTISDGVDLGSLYELSESLAQQGVR